VASGKVDVLDAKSRALEQAQARSVEELGHEEDGAPQMLENAPDFVVGEDQGEPWLPGRPRQVFDPRELQVEDLSVKESERAQRLDVSRRADVALSREAF
jgi:hypothetical protein